MNAGFPGRGEGSPEPWEDRDGVRRRVYERFRLAIDHERILPPALRRFLGWVVVTLVAIGIGLSVPMRTPDCVPPDNREMEIYAELHDWRSESGAIWARLPRTNRQGAR